MAKQIKVTLPDKTAERLTRRAQKAGHAVATEAAQMLVDALGTGEELPRAGRQRDPEASSRSTRWRRARRAEEQD